VSVLDSWSDLLSGVHVGLQKSDRVSVESNV
jgi:hypothetical protein